MSDLVFIAARLRARFSTSIQSLTNISPLLIRLVIAVVFISSGYGKLTDLDKVTEFFTELGIVAPRLNAVVVASTEFFGGLCIAVGLATRLAALPLAMTMVVAIVTALLPDVTGVVELASLSEFAYLTMFLSLVLTGPGRISVDHLITQRVLARTNQSSVGLTASMST